MEVIGFSLNECLSSLSCIRLMIPQKLTGMDEKRKCQDQLKEIKRRYPDGLPLMDPIEDMHITGKRDLLSYESHDSALGLDDITKVM